MYAVEQNMATKLATECYRVAERAIESDEYSEQCGDEHGHYTTPVESKWLYANRGSICRVIKCKWSYAKQGSF